MEGGFSQGENRKKDDDNKIEREEDRRRVVKKKAKEGNKNPASVDFFARGPKKMSERTLWVVDRRQWGK